MWHVETDYFSLAIFLIMVIKNRLLRKERKDFQSDVFYLVLIISIITNIVDILASLSMNYADNWWVYQITMTLYVASMPLLAAVWTCYAYVLILCQGAFGQTDMAECFVHSPPVCGLCAVRADKSGYRIVFRPYSV